jgi:hypothetical protein
MWAKALLVAKIALVLAALVVPWLVGLDLLMPMAGVCGFAAIATGLVAAFRTGALRVRDELRWSNDFGQLQQLWVVGRASEGCFATVIAAAVALSCLVRMALLLLLE